MAIKTTSLETSKALKEAGFRQDSVWYWIQYEDHTAALQIDGHCQGQECYIPADWKLTGYAIAALTTDELLEELPFVIVKENTPKHDVNCWLQIEKTDDKEYIVHYSHSQSDLHEVARESLPEALAQMWLWLRKENLV